MYLYAVCPSSINTMLMSVYTFEDKYQEERDWESLLTNVTAIFNMRVDYDEDTMYSIPRDELREDLLKRFMDTYHEKEEQIGEEQIRFHEKFILLSVIDTLWKDHLLAMDPGHRPASWARASHTVACHRPARGETP